MVKSGVYKITNTIHGKFYIGSSKDIDNRFEEHKQKLRTNKHVNPILQHSWNYHGESNFTFAVIEECEPDKCLEREQYYLDTFQPYKGTGYNINTKAMGGDWFTYHPNRELIREKMKLLNGGENNGMFGKTHSPTSIKKLKEKAKGRYSLEWFVSRYGEQDGSQKYNDRREKLANRKINYVYDNGLKGKTIQVEPTRGASVSRGRNALKERKAEFVIDISNPELSSKQIADKYGISLAGVKYHRRKV